MRSSSSDRSLDQANAQAAARSDAQRQIISSLKQEIACHVESIAQLQAEKRSALTTSATEVLINECSVWERHVDVHNRSSRTKTCSRRSLQSCAKRMS